MTFKSKITLAVCSVFAFSIAIALIPDLEHHKKIDLHGNIHRVEFRGGGVALRLASDGNLTNILDLTSNDSIGCSLKTSVKQSGGTILIEVIKGGFRSAFWCDPDLAVTLPQGFDLDIGLDTLAADISGKYADIRISSEQSIVNFDGAATHFEMQGKRAAVRLNFTNVMPSDAVLLNIRTLLSDVNFAGS